MRIALVCVVFHLKVLHIRSLDSSLHILVLTCQLGYRMCDVCISVSKNGVWKGDVLFEK